MTGRMGLPRPKQSVTHPVQILTRSRSIFVRRASPSTNGRSDAMKKEKDLLLIRRMMIVAMSWNLC